VYRSHLLINVGENPDRPDWEISRRWLRNLYRVHQRLCMAFPSAPRRTDDPAFLKPFASEDFAAQVRVPRSPEAGFLFRIEPRTHGRAVIVVQSSVDPDWAYAFHNASHLLAAAPQGKWVEPTVAAGQRLRFRLRANPTVKRLVDRNHPPKWVRSRVEPSLTAHAHWLARKLGDAAKMTCIETFVPGWAHGWQGEHEPQGKRTMQWWSVLFEGIFQVGDTAALKTLLESGIGSAKAFGFGLLSIAPA
jgi:CRISPR system Cascade subunit CasE